MISARRPVVPILAIIITCLALVVVLPSTHDPRSLLRLPSSPSLTSTLSSPLQRPAASSPTEPQWLLGIFIAPDRFIRRSIIRSTWASRYRSRAPYDYRFIIGNYTSSPWSSLIEAENRTYGDIWALPDFGPETAESANRDKNMHFFSYMATQYAQGQGRRYEFVSKVDDDSWFNVPPYYDAFVAPRLVGGEKYGVIPAAQQTTTGETSVEVRGVKADNDNDKGILTWIGRPMHWDRDYVFASGRIYTLSWPLLELVVEKWRANPLTNLTEDQLMGHYLQNEQIPYEFVVMELEQAWDIGLESIIDSNNATMVIHSVKDDARMLEVSTLFDDEGRWNGKEVDGLTNFNRTMKEVIERIGDVTDAEMVELRKGWQAGTKVDDSKKTLDWKMIREKIMIEDREGMGQMYPLNLPGNNVSTGVVPRRMYNEQWGH